MFIFTFQFLQSNNEWTTPGAAIALCKPLFLHHTIQSCSVPFSKARGKKEILFL
jgi:hypothetical protein